MKGVYALVICVKEDVDVKVGALGDTHFEKGFYVYLGSAQTNMEQRVRRHLRKDKKLFWHIDYLLNIACTKITEVFWKEAAKQEECKIADLISSEGKPVANFGCSDCLCGSHLFKVENTETLSESAHMILLRLEQQNSSLSAPETT